MPSAPAIPKNSPSRSLLPREHGAYAELSLPLLAALLGGHPSAASLLVTASSLLIFLAHEPLLVALGHRGPRALREDGARARRLGVALGGAGGVLGGLALAARPDLWPSFALPATGAAITAALVKGKQEKTLHGELLAAAALSAASVPVAVGAGTPARLACAVWVAWVVTFGAWTWVVRSLIAGSAALLAPLAILGAGGALLGAERASLLPSLIPAAVAAVVLFALRPGPKHLRRVGFGLVGGSLFTTFALAWAMRAG